MIRNAINAELSRRSKLIKPKPPSTAYALAKRLHMYPQSVYRMLDDTRPSFLTEHADAMLKELDLCIVPSRGGK